MTTSKKASLSKANANHNASKPAGYWDDFANVEKELFDFIARHGQTGLMPTKRALQAEGLNGLVSAISKHGGILAVANRLRLARPNSHKASGYWSNLENVRNELLAFITMHGIDGRMPTREELKQANSWSLATAIGRHGGFELVADNLGLDYSTRREAGYWDDFTNLKNELDAFIAEHGTKGVMPSVTILNETRRSDLVNAIRKHGGFPAVAQRLGLSRTQPNKPSGYWENFANVERALEDFIKEHGTDGVMPTTGNLKDEHRADLIVAIGKHGGITAVAQKLGLERPQANKPAKYWEEFSNIEQGVLAFNSAHGVDGVMPTLRGLNAAGYSSLAYAINKHGGFPVVAERLRLKFTDTDKPKDYWNDFINVEKELSAFVEEHGSDGNMPKVNELKAAGRLDLAQAIGKHGGFFVVAERLGLKRPDGSKPFGYWDDFSNVEKELLSFISQRGTTKVMPLQRELYDAGRTDLANAINKYGSFYDVARRLGLNYSVYHWNQNAVLNFLRSISVVLPSLQPAELYAIMRQNGMITALVRKNISAPLIKSIRDLCSSPNPEADFETLVAEIEAQNAALDDDEAIDVETEAISEVVLVEDDETTADLPTLRSLAALKAVDALVDAGLTSDEETIEFLVANRVSGLWQAALNAELAFDLDTLRAETGGAYFNTIRSRFLAQYDGAQNLAIPAGYAFRVEGRLAEPNLMQRLTAYRVLTERRLGNWSGVGAGKTLSAILASRVIDAHLTVIVAFNSTVQPWAKRIIETYPDSVVHIKERGDLQIDQARHTYLVLNFETFQQPDSAALVRRLVAQHSVDLVVLDEIQSVKQRTPNITSKRRQVVSGLLSAASDKNPDLCVLGMSATPVINNLYEAKALLELVKGVEFSDLQTYSSIANASAMHEKLILYGIRYRPQYAQTIQTTLPDIPGADYLSRLRDLKKGAILDLERVLLDAKLPAISGALQKGTLIYTHYLTGLITPLRRAIEQAGFTVGVFTGEDKSGLQPFLTGQVDVLIGSVPVGTGVDGLQYVCNRLIIVSLPWTSAEYEQLIGRLYRQGSVFDKVEVVIPQVSLSHHGGVWSWDKLRWHRIQYKKTLADAALDGVIPEGELSSPDTMFKQARDALQAWITRVEQDDVLTIERARLRVPLPPDDARRAQRRFGDLSTMNARLNTAYSRTTHDRLRQQPEEWYLYHTLYRAARQTWAEIPYEKIAASLKRRPDWIIGDFGCGEAQLAALLPNTVHSFDHVAINDAVIACDMTRTPLDDATLDVAVFSLSLMGLDYADYLAEAHRTLRFGGFLKIAEPISRWQDKRAELLAAMADAGFLLVGTVEESNQFLYIDAIKTDR